jgi:MraZ protein
MAFSGDPRQRIDGKGRMQIPAAMRDVLDLATNGRTAQGTSKGVLNYGLHLDGHLRLYSMHTWAEAVELVMSMDPGSEERELAEMAYLTQNTEVESDREGRIVLPQRLREKLALDEGEVLLLGRGTFVEIWKPDYFEETKGARLRAKMASMRPGFDPISLARRPGS